jgi:hypothetical protein
MSDNVSGALLRSVSRKGKKEDVEGTETYRVSSTELLLCADDGSASLCGVESRFASYDRLSRCSAPAGLGSNFCDGVPVIHDYGVYVLDGGG